MVDHQELIRLTIAYTLAGAFVFTVVITCLSLVGWIRFADKKQQQKLLTCNRNFQSARGQLQDCGDKSRVFSGRSVGANLSRRHSQVSAFPVCLCRLSFSVVGILLTSFSSLPSVETNGSFQVQGFNASATRTAGRRVRAVVSFFCWQ